MRLERVVLDTNVLVSATIAAASAPARVVEQVLASRTLLLSRDLEREYRDVMGRERLDRFTTRSDRERLLTRLLEAAHVVDVTDQVVDCDDPKDNMVLSLAVAGRADCVTTGDDDLLRLNPYHGVAIMRPADFPASE